MSSKAKGELGARLLAHIFEDPNDDDARLVYIDHLLEQNDPRGEYLHLADRVMRSKAEALTTDEISRMNKLLAAHEDEWLGAVAHVTSSYSRRYFRGFLDACDLALLAPGDLDRAIGAREWSTVTCLEREGKSRASDLVRLVLGTYMPILRTIGPLDEPTVTKLAGDETPRPSIEEISFYVVNPKARVAGAGAGSGKPVFFSDDLMQTLGGMGGARGLPGLRRLFVGFIRRAPGGFDPTDVVLAWLWKTPLAQQLDLVGVALDSYAGLHAWLSSIEAHSTSIKELRILPAAGVGSPSTLGSTPGEHLSLQRGEGRNQDRFTKLAINHVRGNSAMTEIDLMLSRLPDDALTHIDLRHINPYRSLGQIIVGVRRQTALEELHLPEGGGVYGTWGDQNAADLIERMLACGVRIERRMPPTS